ncbi:MAG: SGNH/GDSL hydrolase family protein, partial [Candidatus Omnitrophica bacterium]|nr:SGNH/GDSL hydrolase family protein [Candidatus Omnitrophota bacterium]
MKSMILNILKNARWFFTGILLLFGLATIDLSMNKKWAILTILLYSLPLFLQFTRKSLVRVYGIWFGVFILVQAILSPSIEDSFRKNDYKTLYPNLHKIIDVRGDGLPGISGRKLITTDRMGFRTSKDINYLTSDTLRIFAIGSSTTEELYLDNKETWTHHLQEKLSEYFNVNCEVINTGLSGLRARNYLATLKEVIKYHPDLVIFMMGMTDWNRHIRMKFDNKSGPHKNLEVFIKRFSLRNTMLGKFLNNIKIRYEPIKIEHGEFFTLQRNSLSREIKYSFHPAAVSQEYRDFLDEISCVCKDMDLKCLFVTQATGYHQGAAEEFKNGFRATPSGANYTLDFESLKYIAALYNTYLINFAKREKVYYCDVASKIEPSYKYLIDDCHFNENGAKAVADIIFDCVSNIF